MKKKRRRGASHSILEISHLSKIHFSLDPLKERSAEYHHVTDLVAEQRAFWQKKKKIAMGIGLGLFHNSLRKLVSVKRGAGVGIYLFFLENAVLGLVSTLTLKQHSLKKDRPQSLVLLTPFANRFMDFYLSVHKNLGTAACAHCACGFHL